MCRSSDHGVALVIVLAFLVLMAGLVVAFLSRTGTNRQIAHGSFNNSQADQLARSALDIVVADFKQEIVNGSTASTVSNYITYTPSSNANVLPVRSGNPSGSPDPIPNLVRRSVRSDSIVAPRVASRASAINSTTDVSLNNRSVTLPRWNKHYLIPRSTASPAPVPTDTTPVSSFVAPDWVVVTRNGPATFTGWAAGLADATSTNTTYAVGRYAYAVYDEGGLIDLNVAGYPTPTSTPATYVQTIGRKGSVAFADLTQLANMSAGGIGDVIGWRNYATVQPSGSFTSFSFDSSATSRFMTAVLSNTTGFMTVSGTVWNSGTDQAFVNRQSLIQLRGPINFTANALQYLGTFSRELNRPAWKPSTPSGSTINYAAQAENSTAINRDLATVCVTGVFTRPDGSQAAVGEPLLKQRYPLTRINELLNTSNANLKRDFGLVWNSAQNHWDYVGASGSTLQSSIERLDQVAAENREPNFFEILKAVILSGSVGLGSGSANTFVASEPKYYITGTVPSNLLSADYQITQIGANIIDSWDTDNVPTFINFAGNELAGVENLPYLSKLVLNPYWTNPPPVFDAWLIPSLWNPHQNASSAPSTQSVRLAMTSGSMTASVVAKDGSTFPSNPIVAPTSSPAPSPYPTAIQVRANAFQFPLPPNPGIETAPKGSAISQTTFPGLNYDGFHFVFNYSDPNASKVTGDNCDRAFPTFTGGTFEMQVNVNGTWKTYQTWKGCAQPSPSPLACKDPTKGGGWKNNKLIDPEFVALDPRTVRFGVWGGDAFDTTNKLKDFTDGAEDSMDQDKAGLEAIYLLKPQGSAFTVDSAGKAYLYSANSVSGDQYTDLDGVKRQGDWTSDGVGTSKGNTIMYAPNSADRPQVLSTPFQSVAELGQVFRDQPWKTLNFTTANSGDLGLLDAFSLQDIAMMAGKISSNTRQLSVLKAILSQAALRLNGSSILNSTQVTNIATDVASITSTNPVINKADLIAQLATKASFTGLGNKEARECVVRAFSDACQTRTWNLMIDLIAQSGRYPPSATGLSQFVVEGEKRYWLHVAIDRFTGEIIDQQLEAVYE
jgi:Tfp pilus assembly protein PilX